MKGEINSLKSLINLHKKDDRGALGYITFDYEMYNHLRKLQGKPSEGFDPKFNYDTGIRKEKTAIQKKLPATMKIDVYVLWENPLLNNNYVRILLIADRKYFAREKNEMTKLAKRWIKLKHAQISLEKTFIKEERKRDKAIKKGQKRPSTA